MKDYYSVNMGGMGRWIIMGFLVGIWSLPIAPLGAQQPQWSFRHISKRQGLSQNSVFAIAQDGDGFIWFGTRDGLNRYDGYQMRPYRRGDSIAHSLIGDDVRGLYYDAAMVALWVCTREGLSRYRKDTDDFQSYLLVADSTATPAIVRTIIRDGSGHLWAGTDQGLFRYRSEEKDFAHYGAPDLDIQTLAISPSGGLWLGTDKGLFMLAESDTGVYKVLAILDNQEQPLQMGIRSLLMDGTALWIGTANSGLFRWSSTSHTLEGFAHDPLDRRSLSHNTVRTLGKGPQGEIWVGTFMGLNIWRPGQAGFEHVFQEHDKPQSLGSNSIRSIFFDSRGNAWVGTYYGGVNFHSPSATRFTHHRAGTQPNYISHPIVSAFWAEDSAHYWIGTEGGGLNYWDRITGRFRHFRQEGGQQGSLSGNNVKTLWASGDSLWIGCYLTGLDLFRPRIGQWQHFTHQPQTPQGLSNNNVYSLLQEGQTLWIATYGGGLNALNLKTGSFSVSRHVPGDPQSLSTDLTRVLLQDQAGRLWLGTDEGLSRRLGQVGGEWQFAHFLPGVKIISLRQAKDGTLWVGSYRKGLFGLDPTTGQVLRHYTEEDGLPGHTIFGLLEDQLHRIWISTENGLAKLHLQDQQISSYNYSDGLGQIEFNFNAYFQHENGEMFFGGTEGFVSFSPKQIRTNTFVPPVVLTRLSSFNETILVGDASGLLQQSINETDTLIFPYNKANFSLQFAALDYLNPDNNHYSYRLKGLEAAWRYSRGGTEASYTLQRPGTYQFLLKGGNNDGIWNNQPRVLTIKVLPPPWLSGWAYSLYALAGLLMLASGIWFTRLRHRLQLEQVAKDQQEALHQAKLRFYTNITHEFRTPLTLILGPVEELLQASQTVGSQRKLLSVQHHTQKLLHLVNQLLAFRTMETDHAVMQAAPGNIARFLEEVHLSFREHARMRRIDFRFEAVPEEIICWYDRDKLEKVFSNLLGNAFKFTSDGGCIQMRVEQEASSLRILVADDGPGISTHIQRRVFEPYYNESNESNQEGTGIGLALCKQLVELHHGEIALSDALGTGACFEVTLPLGKDHLQPEEIIPDFQSSEAIQPYLTKAAAEPSAPRPPVPAGAEAPLLLVVEDNPAVREYICSVFTDLYRVLEAPDGQVGLRLATEKIPDLIISDVMMPRLDGIAMCSQLKSAVETSHIPILLLTARTGQIFRVEGLETGADAYVSKPFSPHELRLRVRNLLQARQRIRERFAQVMDIKPQDLALTSADEHFLAKAIETVERYMDDPDFVVEQFAREMAVSRPLLFTKLKAITNQTPNNFVKTLRLKRAAQYLRESDMGVAEIAYQVGFRDARYFRKCFQKQWGNNPSTYREQNQVN